jgi:S1-C subfamily serine protease
MSVGVVTSGSAAENAGLQVGDTIIELQGRAAGRESREELAGLNPGDTVTVKVQSRRAGERELKWKVGSRQEISYELKDLDQVTAQQQARRVAWLKGEAQSATDRTSGTAGTGTAK